MVRAIKEEFFWFLQLNEANNYRIYIDGELLDYSDLIIEKQTIDVTELNLKHKFDITFVQWNLSLGKEYSKYYFITSENNERFKEPTHLNKKSDNFNHSVYIKSDYWDEFIFNTSDIGSQIGIYSNKNEPDFKLLCAFLNDFLVKKRKQFLKEDSQKFINTLVNNKVYPEFKNDNLLDTYRKKELDNLVETLYTAKPKIFTSMNNDSKKVFLHLLNMIMDNNNKPELFNILQNVIELDDEEIKDLSDALQYTGLSNITKTIKIIKDRFEIVQKLKQLVFDKELNALEVPHIQKMIEDHYWLFGEQYNLISAAEPDFEKALKGLILATTGKEEYISITHEDKNKEMDIYMIRQDRRNGVIDNVVVELKRPSIALGEKELSQVKKYMRVIQSDPRFLGDKYNWTYYLVGNRFNENGYMADEIKSHKTLGELNLVHAVGNHKIYVRTWSDIFADFSFKHDYLFEKLSLDKELWLKEYASADEIVDGSKNNSAKMPEALIQVGKQAL